MARTSRTVVDTRRTSTENEPRRVLSVARFLRTAMIQRQNKLRIRMAANGHCLARAMRLAEPVRAGQQARRQKSTR